MLLWLTGGILGLILVVRFVHISRSGRCNVSSKLHGKTVIITGASAGVGKETARDLAARGARVILACRNVEKANKVADDIINTTGNNQVIVRELELSSLSSVRRFAKEVLETEPTLNILIYKAGILDGPHKVLTEDGLELTMATNHYGHFLLTNLLLGLLKSSAPSRIINVSSNNYLYVKTFDLNDLGYDKEPFPGGLARYNQSKVANVLFTCELSEKLRGTGVTANALHPGFVKTEIFLKTYGSIVNYVFKGFSLLIAKDEKLGAQTTIYLAVADEVKDISGEFFADCKIRKKSPLASDVGLAKKFWEASESMVKLMPEEQHY